MGQCRFQGSLSILGKTFKKDRTSILKEIGYVPQYPPPIQLSVKALIGFYSDILDIPSEEIIKEEADGIDFDLAPHFNKTFSKLSGGMKQKLLISLAFVKKPKLIIMDEPSSNIDPLGRSILYQSLSSKWSKNSLILSCHRLEEIETIVNRVVEMDGGKVVSDYYL